jgi:hypothetical protein
MALIQTPVPPIESRINLTPSLEILHIVSPEPESLPIPPWFLDDLYEDLPPNPPNSPVHVPMEILHPTITNNPQFLMSHTHYLNRIFLVFCRIRSPKHPWRTSVSWLFLSPRSHVVAGHDHSPNKRSTSFIFRASALQ